MNSLRLQQETQTKFSFPPLTYLRRFEIWKSDCVPSSGSRRRHHATETRGRHRKPLRSVVGMKFILKSYGDRFDLNKTPLPHRADGHPQFGSFLQRECG